MRVCLVSHGFPPLETTGVENYTAALAKALVASGHTVEVFVPRMARELPDLSLRREERDGYGLSWLTTNSAPRDQEERLDLPGVAERFGDFLDRERPEVIHFQHVIKLGLSLIKKARERGIPTLYTAHDYYPVCHRFTLMKPDLSRCQTVGDSQLCSRCDLALSFLDRQENLSDYQMGALPEQLGSDGFRALQDLLAGNPHAGGFSVEEQTAFETRRANLDRTRREAYAQLDLVLSPTRFLADKLVAGGLDADRIRVLTYGAETAGLDALERPARTPDRPLRFGYLGGLSKHKGVHVLVRAFEGLGPRASLDLWGGSSDLSYGTLIENAAQRAGAHVRGPFRRGQLAECLAEVDVVVVPSTWVENYPFAIREAFAAGRPVITTAGGALGESVRHGVDGLLVPPDDVDALRAAMRRLIEEPDLLGQLVAGIEPVKSIETQVEELVPIYTALADDAARHAEEEPDLPPSVRRLRERYRELSAMPLRDLFRGVLGDLGKVRAALGGVSEEGAERTALDELSVEALVAGSHTQVLLRDLKREKDWLRGSLSSFEKTESALRERLSWRERELESRADEADWLRHMLEENQKGLEEVREENTWLRDLVRKKERELQDANDRANWLDDLLEERKRESAWLRDTLVAYERDIAWHQEKVRAQDERLTGLEEENAAFKRQLHEEREHLRDGLKRLGELAQRAVEVQEQVFGPSTLPLLQELSENGEAATLERLSQVVLEGNQQIFELLDELKRRRVEMRAAMEEADRTLAQLLIKRTGLGRRVKRWRTSNGFADEPDLPGSPGHGELSPAPRPEAPRPSEADDAGRAHPEETR